MYVNTLLLEKYTLGDCPKCNALADEACLNKKGDAVNYVHKQRLVPKTTANQSPLVEIILQADTAPKLIPVDEPTPEYELPPFQDTTEPFLVLNGFKHKVDKFFYDYVEHETEKAYLFHWQGYEYWIPKGVLLSHTEEAVFLPHGLYKRLRT